MRFDPSMKPGLLIINLGTPEAADRSAVSRYLRQFLADSRVINLPAVLRYLLLYTVILPFRPQKAAKAYQAIWTKEGSPLMVNSRLLLNKLREHYGNSCQIALGMRYGKPSIASALQELSDCDSITVLPLYPQYSSAATGSSIQEVLSQIAGWTVHPNLQIIRDFCQHLAYIQAQAQAIRPFIQDSDYLLFSYHGLPEHHLSKAGCVNLCADDCPVKPNSVCYRAQCQQTTRDLAQVLDLRSEKYGSAFQSRLGKTPWIKPYTDEVLPELVQQGIKRLAVCCPSFVADCVETLEEVGMRARKQWLDCGGEEFILIPALNDTDSWITAILEIVGLSAIEHTYTKLS